jgi:hypothetical protein
MIFLFTYCWCYQIFVAQFYLAAALVQFLASCRTEGTRPFFFGVPVPADPFVCTAECATRDSVRAPGSVAFPALELVPHFDLRSARQLVLRPGAFSQRAASVSRSLSLLSLALCSVVRSASARYRSILCVWLVPCSVICGLLFLMRFAAVLDASD